MIKVCLIGNSHVGTLKYGVPEVQPEFPQVSLTFFASAGTSMDLVVKDGRLCATTSGIRQRMAMTSQTDGDIAPIYDAYIVCGLTLSSFRSLRTVRPTVEALREAGRHRDVKTEDIADGMLDAVLGSMAFDVLAKLRQLTPAPAYVIATPHVSYERHAEVWERQQEAKIEMLADAFNLACRWGAEDANATFLPQPAETVGPNLLTTKAEFYLLPLEKVKEETAIHTHMNAAFGAIVLRDALQRIVAQLETGQA
jgi:hypothetical protein